MSLKKSLEKLKSLITAVEINQTNQMNEGSVPTSTAPKRFINGPIDCKDCCYMGQVNVDGTIYAVIKCFIDGFYKQYLYNGYTEQSNIVCKPGTGSPPYNTILHCNNWMPGGPIKPPPPPRN